MVLVFVLGKKCSKMPTLYIPSLWFRQRTLTKPVSVRYQCTADLPFDWLGFNQTSKMQHKLKSTKINRNRKVILLVKLVFSGLGMELVS